MKDGHDIMDEARSLVAAVREETATAAQLARLDELISQHEPVRAYYVQAMHQHASLYWYLKAATSEQLTAEEKSDRIGALGALAKIADFESSRPLGLSDPAEETSAGGRGRWRVRSIRGAIAASVLLSVGLLGLIALSYLTVPAQPTDSGVATLTETYQADWANEQGQPIALFDGQSLRPRKLKLLKGLAKITFHDGARVVLDARRHPAQLELMTAGKGYLAVGRLSARVEGERAKGFTIEGPGFQVVDLGTEFGVIVDPDGRAEVHVIEGEVQTRLTRADGRTFDETTSRVVRDDQAISIAKLRTGPTYRSTSFDEDRFVRIDNQRTIAAIVAPALPGGSTGPAAGAQTPSKATGAVVLGPVPTKVEASSEIPAQDNYGGAAMLFDGAVTEASIGGAGELGKQYAGVGPGPHIVYMDYGRPVSADAFVFSQRFGAVPEMDKVTRIDFWFEANDPSSTIGSPPTSVPPRDPDESVAVDNMLNPNLVLYPLSGARQGRYVVMRLHGDGQPGSNTGGWEFRLAERRPAKASPSKP